MGVLHSVKDMKLKSNSWLFLVAAWACCAAPKPPALPVEGIETIAFGSCNQQNAVQSFWPVIAAQNPDLWIWLGDNIYADTDDMQVMASKYQQQLNVPGYQSFRQQVPVIGIWDDHDYGMNDGNRTFRQKHQAKAQFMSFMGLDDSHAMRQHAGIYHSLVLGQPPQQIKILLLDTRTFQDPLKKSPPGSHKNYLPNHGTLLGAEQWRWLTQELQQSTAQINVIASSIQVIAKDHRYEMWANFPKERTRLLDLLVSSGANNPLILSGDRHLSEVSKINWQGLDIYDITASGMTHSFRGNQEFNAHRIGELVVDKSFSTLSIDWSRHTAVVKQFSTQGALLNQVRIKLK